METIIRTKKKRSIKKWLLLILAAIIVLFVIIQLYPVEKVNQQAFKVDGKQPLIIAHQGGAGNAPSNTMAAFELAEAMNVDMLEMDVHLTKDGEVVVIHDETVDRTTNGTGKVKDMTLVELKQLDAGYHFIDKDGKYSYRDKGVEIPKLSEIFQRFNDYNMVIELKTVEPKLADATYKLIEQYGMSEKVIIGSFHDKQMDYFKKLTKGKVPTSSAESATRTYVITNKAYLSNLIKMDYTAVQIPMSSSGLDLTTDRLISDLHKRNIAVQYWTINDEDDVRKLAKAGADGIMTDYPNMVKKVLKEVYN